MEKDELEERAREILSRHLEYMDGLSRGQVHMKVSNALEAVKDALRSHINKEGRGMNECSIGVGDGSGQLFVRGSYEAVKHVQSIIFELEVLRARQAREEHP